jgi:hypothetical protein
MTHARLQGRIAVTAAALGASGPFPYICLARPEMRRSRGYGAGVEPNVQKDVSESDNGRLENGSLAETTLHELATKLSELRQHLEQVVTGLNDLREESRGIRNRSHAATAGRLPRFRIEDGSLRCHACGRASPSNQSGWTLRLCGDDELHPFCPECDRRDVSDEAGGRRDAQRG